MSCYIHHVPGRLRVRVAAAKGDPHSASGIVRRLLSLDGVTGAEANTVTGSILVWYDTERTDAAACMTILNVDRPDASATLAERPPRTGRVVAKVAEAAAWYLLEKALERSVLFVFAALL